MVNKDNSPENDKEWVKKALTNFEELYPGLVEKLTVISSQNQVRLSMFPQPPVGGASSNTGE